MTALIETRRLCKSFGALTVAKDIDFRLCAGARHALIGPNGAGKTTFVDLLTGRLAPSSGQVSLAGRDISRLQQSARVRLGLARTFQINSLFASLSVLDNVALAVAERDSIAGRMWRAASTHRTVREEVLELLSGLGLADDAAAPVAALPYGKQRLVEIAVALGLRPKVLLLDEPAAGVPSFESQRILSALERLPQNMAILLIEHDMDLVFRFASRITVLVQGEVLCEGSPAEVIADRRVRLAYLGESHA